MFCTQEVNSGFNAKFSITNTGILLETREHFGSNGSRALITESHMSVDLSVSGLYVQVTMTLSSLSVDKLSDSMWVP